MMKYSFKATKKTGGLAKLLDTRCDEISCENVMLSQVGIVPPNYGESKVFNWAEWDIELIPQGYKLASEPEPIKLDETLEASLIAAQRRIEYLEQVNQECTEDLAILRSNNQQLSRKLLAAQEAAHEKTNWVAFAKDWLDPNTGKLAARIEDIIVTEYLKSK